jgi:hypothetical protein
MIIRHAPVPRPFLEHLCTPAVKSAGDKSNSNGDNAKSAKERQGRQEKQSMKEFRTT